MIKSICTTISFLLITIFAEAQSFDLPVKEFSSAMQTPFVLYISGDGGFNSFSTDLCNAINKAGYSITALNAKSYFWDKKTSLQTANDIAAYLKSQLIKRKNQKIILVGYSFGADVMPFIVNQLSDSVKNKILSIILLSPSTSTDFEIHLLDMFGTGKKRSMDVVAEINKLGTQKVALIFGGDENNFPLKEIKLRNCTYETLPGGHHYDGNIAEVTKSIIERFN